MANDNNSVLAPKQWLKQNLQLVLREFWSSITAVFATKQQVTEGLATKAPLSAALYPVDVNTLTPTSTFVANAIIGINGVIYRAKQATSNFPVPLVVDNGAFVVQTVNGKIVFTVSSNTIHQDWEQWTDAAIEYWKAQLDARVSALENKTVTYNNQTYTVNELLTAMASLMQRTIVVTG